MPGNYAGLFQTIESWLDFQLIYTTIITLHYKPIPVFSLSLDIFKYSIVNSLILVRIFLPQFLCVISCSFTDNFFLSCHGQAHIISLPPFTPLRLVRPFLLHIRIQQQKSCIHCISANRAAFGTPACRMSVAHTTSGMLDYLGISYAGDAYK